MYAKTCAVMISMLFIHLLSAHANAAEPEVVNLQDQGNKVELRISKDGKAIVDQNEQEVARFVEGTQVKQKGGLRKVGGCLCCTDECLIYDQNGVCIKKVRSCVYDFECSCRQ